MKLVRRKPTSAYLDTWLWVPKRFMNLEGTKRALQFAFTDSHSQKIRYISMYRETEHHLLVPREFYRPEQLPFPLIDCRPQSYEYAPITHRIQLDHKLQKNPDGSTLLIPTGNDVQAKSIEAFEASTGGILQLACGKGKTVVALYYIAQRKVPALIIVDTTHLVHQWREEIERFLDVPGGVGLVQAEVFDWKKYVVIATYQTIASRADILPEEMKRWFGTIIWDEGHHISAPTFSKGADLFPGKRIALTATPSRDDGTHVIYEYHIGEVVYKNLIQDLKPLIAFRWTGLKLDHTIPANEVTDVNGMLHTSKLAVFFGKWINRMVIILEDAKEALAKGRKILVLSNSVDEAINLLTIWTRGYPTPLYTDILIPTPVDVGETLNPVYLKPKERKKLTTKLAQSEAKLDDLIKRVRSQALNPVKKTKLLEQKKDLEEFIGRLQQTMKQDKVGKKIAKEHRRRQKKYREDLLAESTTAGLMIYKVDPAQRVEFLKTRPVVFAISKYGREALNCLELDTVLVSVPFSSRNGLQQLLGRPSREYNLKLDPIVVIYEDNIGVLIGMCQKLRKHIREWPLEDNGPYEYELFGHPHARGKPWKSPKVFGP